MTNPDKALYEAVRQYVGRMQAPEFHVLEQFLMAVVEDLAHEGELVLGREESLTGRSLEFRVFHLLGGIGLPVARGREGMEDGIVSAPEGFEPGQPLVLEIKSSRNPQLSRDNLRQIDDWIFDLSGEEMARKHGLGGGLDPMAILSQGLRTRRRRHPSPHKGLLIFNGPLQVPFTERQSSCVSENDVEFIEKRNICVMPFGELVAIEAACRSDTEQLSATWRRIHDTAGIYRHGDTTT